MKSGLKLTRYHLNLIINFNLLIYNKLSVITFDFHSSRYFALTLASPHVIPISISSGTNLLFYSTIST
ncbi:hypothetical protein BpHYR1_047822 [Brachionus plicatilis]|uniref:Uncharacterized protein n=1 Tax=Brachionus plicatilis TaxID=10195 RepID=A0A3M7RTP5_BRAPC|nr:hypothetical protein BpHYR1_047822 [Brachionus plicatilis]